MSRIPKKPPLHSDSRPTWTAKDERSELRYLGWGLRGYGDYPSGLGMREVWSYSVILRGSPLILLADGKHPLSPQQALLFPAHGTFPVGFRDKPGRISEVLIWVWRTPPVVAEIQPPLRRYLILNLDRAACDRLRVLHSASRREVARADKFTAQFLKGLRSQLDIEFARAATRTVAMPRDELRAQEAVRWLLQNLHERDPVFLLCDYLQVSHSTLNRLFLAVFGESPSSCYRRLRMEEAQRLVAEKKLSVKQIAYALGYRHPNAFSRAFKTYQRSMIGKR